MHRGRTGRALAAGATAGAALALALAGAGSAVAGGIPGSDGKGTFTVHVEVSGSGAGTGGSLAGPAEPAGSGGGSVAVHQPCGYVTFGTQQELEASYNGDKAALQDYVNKLLSLGGLGSYWVTIPLAQGQLAAWGKTGTWYASDCDRSVDQAGWQLFALSNPPVLVGPGSAGAPPQPSVDPKVLLAAATRAMTLPTPVVGYDPARQGYVNLPTWVWVSPQMAPGRSLSVTASARGESATVVATYHGTDFAAGGGSHDVSCADGGHPYHPGAASLCTLTFDRGGAFTVTASSHWSAVGEATGIARHAIAGADMVGLVDLPVAEIQTVVTR